MVLGPGPDQGNAKIPPTHTPFPSLTLHSVAMLFYWVADCPSWCCLLIDGNWQVSSLRLRIDFSFWLFFLPFSIAVVAFYEYAPSSSSVSVSCRRRRSRAFSV